MADDSCLPMEADELQEICENLPGIGLFQTTAVLEVAASNGLIRNYHALRATVGYGRNTEEFCRVFFPDLSVNDAIVDLVYRVGQLLPKAVAINGTFG